MSAGYDNIGSLNSGSSNRGESLTGYSLQGYKRLGTSLSATQSAILIGKPAPPAPPPGAKRAPPPPGRKKAPPPPKGSNNTPPSPGEDGGDGGGTGGEDTPPPPPPTPNTCPPPDNSTCPPCDCSLDIFDPNAPPSPPPVPSTPSNGTDDGTELPSSCTNPCFKYDPENKTCSLSVCDDPCEDCFQSGTQTACLEVFGLNRFSTEDACKAGPNCDPTGKCLQCKDGKWGCIESFRR